jgi:hypothetical protein
MSEIDIRIPPHGIVGQEPQVPKDRRSDNKPVAARATAARRCRVSQSPRLATRLSLWSVPTVRCQHPGSGPGIFDPASPTVSCVRADRGYRRRGTLGLMPSAYPPDLTDDELLEEARRTAGNVTFIAPTYLEELNRRTVDRQTKQMISLTDEIRRLTNQLRWLTGAAVALAVLAILISVIALVVGRAG